MTGSRGVEQGVDQDVGEGDERDVDEGDERDVEQADRRVNGGGDESRARCGGHPGRCHGPP